MKAAAAVAWRFDTEGRASLSILSSAGKRGEIINKRRDYLGAGLAVCLMVAAGMAQAQKEAEASLYDRLSGLLPITVVVSDFIDVLLVDVVLNANPAVDEARKCVPAPYLKYRVTSLVCQATGGPCEYQGRSM